VFLREWLLIGFKFDRIPLAIKITACSKELNMLLKNKSFLMVFSEAKV
jgi:hypothetical protein